jgi:N-hydroxyarylamine O-acetyltransferase
VDTKEIRQYFDRIGLSGVELVDLNTLRHLQRRHLLKIPFENLDIHYGRKIRLDPRKLFEKIVLQKRGGFCYELNGLFNGFLQTLGYATYLVSARVSDGRGGFGEEFDHMAIIVRIDGKEYLTDVGFGEFTFEPLRVETNLLQTDERGLFVIENYDETYLIVRKLGESGKEDQYLFSLAERRIEDFAGMCNYHQTSPKSHFTQKKICSLPFEGGRYTLTGDSFKVTKGSMITEEAVNNEDHFRMILKQAFEIEL